MDNAKHKTAPAFVVATTISGISTACPRLLVQLSPAAAFDGPVLRCSCGHQCCDQWAGRKSNSGMAFSWWIWDRNYTGPTIIDRISWGHGGPVQNAKAIERELVNQLVEFGLPCFRVTLSGAAGGEWTGDIHVPLLGRTRRVEWNTAAADSANSIPGAIRSADRESRSTRSADGAAVHSRGGADACS